LRGKNSCKIHKDFHEVREVHELWKQVVEKGEKEGKIGVGREMVDARAHQP
jgi:hypothetical protein